MSRASRARRGALALALACAARAIGTARALTCRCADSVQNTGTCTHLTLVNILNASAVCDILSGTTLTGNIYVDGRHHPLTFDLSSSGATTLVGDIQFEFNNAGSLLDKMTTIHLGSIATIDGSVHVHGNSDILTTFNASSLVTAKSFTIRGRHDGLRSENVDLSSLTTLTERYAAQTEYSLWKAHWYGESHWELRLPSLTSAAGVNCANCSMPALVNVSGSVEFIANATAFPNLERVDGALSVNKNSTVSFPKLKHVGGGLSVRLEYHDGSALDFSELSTVVGGMQIFSADDAFLGPGSSIATVQQGMPPGLSRLTQIIFPKLTSVTGPLLIGSFWRVRNISLPELVAYNTTFGSDAIKLMGMPMLEEFHIPKLSVANYTGPSSYASILPCVGGLSNTYWPESSCDPAQPHDLKIFIKCESPDIVSKVTSFPVYGNENHTRSIIYPPDCPHTPAPPPPPWSTPPGGGGGGSGGGGGGGGGGSSSPPAMYVTTADLQASVAACFQEDPAGNCVCGGIGCGSLGGPISQWRFTGNNLDMDGLFEAKTTFNQPIGSWDVSGATSMKRMFKNATAFNQPIGSWDTAAVTDMTEMFAGAASFARDISTWNVISVSASSNMFDGATAFNAKYTCVGAQCTGDPKSDSGLSAGEVAGIAVGCIAFAVICIVVVCVRRRRRFNNELRTRLGIPSTGVSPAPASAPQPQIIIVHQ